MSHFHELGGCAPTPLAHYLKALGVLRLVAEQVDESARGWWKGNRFLLATRLTKEELEGFFLHEYQPTPFVSPWNKGAGFFSKEDPGIHPLENSKSRRFESYRSGIEASRSRLEQLSKADKSVRDVKAEAKQPGMSKAEKERIRNSEDYKRRLREADKRFKRLKANVIPDLRSNWRGPHREWMDAAMVLGGDGTPKYPALLGSGGNGGRLDFTNNFMQRLGDVFDLDSDDGGPRPAAPIWLSGALWSQPVPGNLPGKVGQYLPGTAGGANNGNGPDAGSMVNPVDFILMLEGTIPFTSHASRRFGSSESSRAASPFAVNARGAAYASAAASDESARGEQWMPLWSHPLSYAELRRLLAEGRAQIGSKAAREPLDVARAVKRLGIARGIEAFQRYGYIERNGQSNLAVPLGRFEASDEPSGSLACIDDLDAWLHRLRREARGRHAPARLTTAERRLADALFAVAERPQSPEGWQRALTCLAEVERTMRSGSGFDAQPVPRLRPEWITASCDGTAEFRLALSFALQSCTYRIGGRHVEDQVRRHWLPLERKRPEEPSDPERRPRFATTGAGSTARLAVSPEVVMDGRRGLDDAIALVERRLVEGSQREGRRLPLGAAPHAAAGVADLAGLLSGGVDLDRTLALARALMALDRSGSRAEERYVPTGSPRAPDWPDDAWLAIRLCALPWLLKTRSGFDLDVGTDPAIVRRLAAGDAASAVALALRRLGAAGVRCTVRVAATSPATARLWAAALAFPITERTAERFLYRLDPNLDPNKE